MPQPVDDFTLRLALPKGRMAEGVNPLLADAGIQLTRGRARLSPRALPPGLRGEAAQAAEHRRDAPRRLPRPGLRRRGLGGGAGGRARRAARHRPRPGAGGGRGARGAAWTTGWPATGRTGGRLGVRAAHPPTGSPDGGLDARFVRSFGATEVFPPEDADCIVDNTATGGTLRGQRAGDRRRADALLHRASTPTPRRWSSPRSASGVEQLVLLLRSVLEARRRVMLEVNVAAADLEAVVAVLPCMREPTIATLHGDAGYAVKAAVPRDDLPRVIPESRRRGGTDIVVTALVPDRAVRRG